MINRKVHTTKMKAQFCLKPKENDKKWKSSKK